MTEAEDVVVTKLARRVIAPMVSYRFFSASVKVYVFSRSRREAWDILGSYLRPDGCRDFSLDKVEVPIRLWEDEN